MEKIPWTIKGQVKKSLTEGKQTASLKVHHTVQ